MSKIQQTLAGACEGMHVCFVGGPCLSGKTTLTGLATQLLNHLGLAMLDMSDIVKSEIRNATRIGRVFRRHQRSADQGGLQPDNEVMLAVAGALQQCKQQGRRYVFMVGVPRTEAQANIIIESGIDYSSVHITASDERLRENLARRQRAGQRRSDDRHFERRMRIYREHTIPAMGWLELDAPERSVEIELGGSMSPPKVIFTMIGVCTCWDRTFLGEVESTFRRKTHPAFQQIAALA